MAGVHLPRVTILPTLCVTVEDALLGFLQCGLLGWDSMFFSADLKTSLSEVVLYVNKSLSGKEAMRWS